MRSNLSQKNFNNKPLISFIVASYNVSSSLERCLQSILNQSLDHYEVLIINDKSTDNTLEIAQSFAEKDKKNRFKVLSHLQNRGLAAVRNTGLLASVGEYIWHIDGDDYLGIPYAAEFVAKKFSEAKVPVVKVGVYEERQKDDFKINCKQKDYSEIDVQCQISTPSELLNNNGLGGVFGYIFNRNLAIELGLRNIEGINIGEDQIFLAQLYRAVPTIYVIKNYFYVYDKTEASIMRSKWKIEKFLEDRFYTYFFMEIFGANSINFAKLAQQRLGFVFKDQRVKAKEDLSNSMFELIDCIYMQDFINFIKFENVKNNSNIMNNWLKKNYWSLIEKYELQNSIPSFLLNSEVIDYLFKETEFIIHLGVHKTATTYIQQLLKKNKFDLALEGILIVDFEIFRELIDNGKIEKTDENIYKYIIKGILPLLFVKPKKIIISDENMIFPGRIIHEKDYNQDLSRVASCSKYGCDLRLLEQVTKVLPNSKLFLAIRDYKDYLVSMHSERCLWEGYYNIEESVEGWDFNNYCDWNFLIDNLTKITNEAKNSSLLVTRFEDYKKNPAEFASLLVGVKIKNTNNLDRNDRELFRNKASSETIDFIEKYKNENKDKKSINKLYRKLINSNYGFSDYIPNFVKNNSFFNERDDDQENTSKSYKKHCDEIDLIDIPIELTKINKFKRDITFNSLVNFNNINLDFEIENFDNYKKKLLTTFFNPKLFKNIEGNEKYFYYRDRYKSKNGISALLRIKNEEMNIKNVLLGIVNVFDEIILVDNNSTDKTMAVVKELKEENQEFMNKLKIYNYPFQVAKCGIENFNTHPNSLNSLAYFYNYSLSKCNFSHVMKWDGDMFLPGFLKDYFKNYISKLIKNKKPVLGIPRGLTVYKGLDGKFYYRANSFEAEIRIFNNYSANTFEKDILWERLQNKVRSEKISSGKNVFIEYKDVNKNEFSHWDEGYLGMGPRKRRELKDFKIIHKLTLNKEEEDISTLTQALGFNTIAGEKIFEY